MKKLGTKEWVAVAVALIVVGIFLIFPQVLRSNRNTPTSPEIPQVNFR